MITQPNLTETQLQDLAKSRTWTHKLGDRSWVHKELVEEFARRHPLDGARVLELGPFEGHHTVQLVQQLGATHVTCVEPRPLNAIAVYTRAMYHGVQDRVRVVIGSTSVLTAVDVDEFDVLIHLGVLYHMIDPVTHVLRDFMKFSRVLLDTHVLEDGVANKHRAFRREVSVQGYRGREYRERGWSHSRAGLHDHSVFLYESSMRSLLEATDPRVDDLRRAPHELSPRQAFALSRK